MLIAVVLDVVLTGGVVEGVIPMCARCSALVSSIRRRVFAYRPTAFFFRTETWGIIYLSWNPSRSERCMGG